MLTDNVKLRIQQSDGTYIRCKTEGEPLDTQVYFYRKAYDAAEKAKAAAIETKPKKLVAKIRKISKK